MVTFWIGFLALLLRDGASGWLVSPLAVSFSILAFLYGRLLSPVPEKGSTRAWPVSGVYLLFALLGLYLAALPILRGRLPGWQAADANGHHLSTPHAPSSTGAPSSMQIPPVPRPGTVSSAYTGPSFGPSLQNPPTSMPGRAPLATPSPVAGQAANRPFPTRPPLRPPFGAPASPTSAHPSPPFGTATPR